MTGARKRKSAALAPPFGEIVAAEARTWIDTPFVWNQSQKGRGCDCKGVLRGVARELGRPEAESLYARFSGYRVDRPVPSALLVEGMAALFDRVESPVLAGPSSPTEAGMQPGDVLLLKHGGVAGHIAIFVGDGRAVHAYPGARSKVMERDLRVVLHRHPLHSIWRWR